MMFTLVDDLGQATILGADEKPRRLYTLTGIDENGACIKRTVGSMEVLDRVARFAINHGWVDMEVRDDLGADVTCDVPAFQE